MWCKLRALLLLGTCACAQVITNSASGSFPPDENPRYFPGAVFADEGSDGSFRARWYAKQLRALKEPSLSETPPASGESIYRFTWLRSFHHPISIRITFRDNEAGRLTAKMTGGNSGYAPGTLIVNSMQDMGVNDVSHLRKLIEAMDFWQMPAELASSNVVALDGAQWILEGFNRGHYHVIDRWSPREGPLRQLGIYLVLTLARLDVPPESIY